MLRTVDVMVTHSCELAAASSMSITTASTINHKSPPRWPFFRRPPTRRGLRPRPGVEQFVAERARHGHAGLQDPFPDRELARPPAELVLATELMNRGFDQRPAHPRRSGLGDPA